MQIRLHGARHVGIQRRGDQHLVALRHARRHAQRRARGLRTVVIGHVDHVAVQQLGHHALVLETGLEASVILVRLAGVGRKELGAVDHLVHQRWNIAVITARAEEAGHFAGRLVLVQNSRDMADKIALRRVRLRKFERLLHEQLPGNVLPDQLVDGFRPNELEHLRLNGRIGVGNVGIIPFRHRKTSLKIRRVRRCRRRRRPAPNP